MVADDPRMGCPVRLPRRPVGRPDTCWDLAVSRVPIRGRTPSVGPHVRQSTGRSWEAHRNLSEKRDEMVAATCEQESRTVIQSRPTDVPAGSTPSRVLVIDDEPAITDLLGTALRYMGFEVRTAGTRPAALAAARDHD